MPTTVRSTSRDKLRAHRTRLRKAGLRPVQIWVPDVRSKSFARAARRQSLAVAKSPHARSEPGVHRRDFGLECRMKRGEIWTVARGAAYAGKPRPAVIVQDDRFDVSAYVRGCPCMPRPIDMPDARGCHELAASG